MAELGCKRAHSSGVSSVTFLNQGLPPLIVNSFVGYICSATCSAFPLFRVWVAFWGCPRNGICGAGCHGNGII